MATKKKLTFSTQKGIAMYPWLNKADYQFDSNGQFKVNLKMPKDHAKDLIAQVQQAAEDEFGKAEAGKARMPFKTDDDTGDLIIVTKSKFKPKFMDSQGQLISENNVPQIFGGSTLKLAGTIYPYVAGGNKGVSLQLAGVQIIELSEGQGGGVTFGAEEGGYVAANDNELIEEGGQAYNF
jgi:hypothetical protein